MSHDLRAPMSDDTLAAWRHLVAEYAAIDWMSYDGNIHRTADRYRHIPTAVWLEIMDELIARRAAAVSPPQTPDLRADVQEGIAEWEREIAEFATKDDPYYNGVRQCVQDAKSWLEAEPAVTPAAQERQDTPKDKA